MEKKSREIKNKRRIPGTSRGEPFVSVIIPTYNRKNILEVTLKAILDQNYHPDRYEIIVVDDGSDDGTKEFVLSLAENSEFADSIKRRLAGFSGLTNYPVKLIKFIFYSFFEREKV